MVKKTKTKIKHAMRVQTWNQYIGANIGRILCLLCERNYITQLEFSCCHVLAESQGGSICVENLRPLCSWCNGSMGSQHMKEFARINYPQSPLLLTLPDPPTVAVPITVAVPVTTPASSFTINVVVIPNTNISNASCTSINVQTTNVPSAHVPNANVPNINIPNDIINASIDDSTNVKVASRNLSDTSHLKKKSKLKSKSNQSKKVKASTGFIIKRSMEIQKMDPQEIGNKYVCQHCNGGFAQKSSLNRHIRDKYCKVLNPGTSRKELLQFKNDHEKSDQIIEDRVMKRLAAQIQSGTLSLPAITNINQHHHS
jgi:hypothetical protein